MPSISNAYDDLIFQAVQSYDVPFAWVKAVIGTESDFDPNAYRAERQINDASRGLMQILFRTAQGLGYEGEPDGLYDPATNINLGAKFLADLRSQYGDDFKAVYSAYNSGSPKAYLTNSTVADHVNRAQSYLNAVMAVTAEVTGEPGGMDMSILAGFAVVAGVALFFFTKR
jgi:soluble lytic murein transglycosylase-like protein